MKINFKKMFEVGMLSLSITAIVACFSTKGYSQASLCQPAQNGCTATCGGSSCSSSGAGPCSCGCVDGIASCACGSAATFCMSSSQVQCTQFLGGLINLMNSFNTPEGFAGANDVSGIVSLFQNNNYFLNDNSPQGDVNQYRGLVNDLKVNVQPQFSPFELQQINNYVNVN